MSGVLVLSCTSSYWWKTCTSCWVSTVFLFPRTMLMNFTKVWIWWEFQASKQNLAASIGAKSMIWVSYLRAKNPPKSFWKIPDLTPKKCSLFQSISHPLNSSCCKVTAWILSEEWRFYTSGGHFRDIAVLWKGSVVMGEVWMWGLKWCALPAGSQ